MRVMAWHPTTSGISTGPSVCEEGRDRGGRGERKREKGRREKWKREGRKEGRKEGRRKGERRGKYDDNSAWVDIQLRTPPSLSQQKKIVRREGAS